MGSWARKFLPDRLTPTRWKELPPGLARDVAQEQAEKTEALVFSIDHLAVMDPSFVLPWLGEACPPGWELVAELDGKFLMGTTEAAGDVGTPGGSTAHSHTIDHGHSASAAAAADHSHVISSAGSHSHSMGANDTSQNMANVLDSSVSYIWSVDSNTGSAGSHDHGGATAAGGAHNHAITVNNHAGSSGSASSLPPYVKVIFCRRKL
jgi:hypothetical protein